MGDITKIKTIPATVIFDALDLGYTSTPIEVGIEGKYKDITVDQLGDEIVAKINQGLDVTVKATFKEVDKVLLSKMYGASALASEYTDGQCTGGTSTGDELTEAACTLVGGTWTPATESVLGFGSANVGTNLASTAKLLKLIPNNVAEKNKSLILWKAYPIPGGLKYSGVEENEVEIEFRIIEDKTKPAQISKGYLGNPDMMPNFVE
jgi:hypothetical protein